MQLVIDLFAGLGGWAEGFLEEGYRVIGFDIERLPYPGQLVMQDVRTLHGSRFKGAAIIVASPPCNEYSYRAMPWKRAKALPPPSNELFDACFRIQREASEAAGRKIPMIVENVRGAQKWVGRARWHYGSYYLWGDVPASMPVTKTIPKFIMDDIKNGQRRQVDGVYENGAQIRRDDCKVPGFRFDGSGRSFQPESVDRHIKNKGGSWFAVAHNTTSGHGRNPDGRKFPGMSNGRDFSKRPVSHWGDRGTLRCLENGSDGIKQGGEWWRDQKGLGRFSSRSSARKQASAMIAKIPFPLAQYIARVYKPKDFAPVQTTG